MLSVSRTGPVKGEEFSVSRAFLLRASSLFASIGLPHIDRSPPFFGGSSPFTLKLILRILSPS